MGANNSGMDHLDSMRLFIRIVDRRSFTLASSDLGIPRSTATVVIRELERHLNCRLLNRTTRVVSPTADGQIYYGHCVAVLASIDEAEASFRNPRPSGLLRIDAHGMLSRTFLLPKLPEFLARYPELDLHIGQGDRLVDLVREGIDCAIRVGDLTDSTLIRRTLASIPEITCASPEYLARHGTPRTPDDLASHQMIGFVSSRTGTVLPLEFRDGEKIVKTTLKSRVTVNDSDSSADLARLGLGLVQAPLYRFSQDLASGTLVEVLKPYRPTESTVSALYPQSRQTSPRLRVFLDWASTVFGRIH